jgi:hypothetical protein
MSDTIDLNGIYVPSDGVVDREIKGEILIVPLTSGIGLGADEIGSFDEVGRAVWEKIDGSRSVAAVVRELAGDFDDPEWLLEDEVVGFLQDLLERGIIVEKG